MYFASGPKECSSDAILSNDCRGDSLWQDGPELTAQGQVSGCQDHMDNHADAHLLTVLTRLSFGTVEVWLHSTALIEAKANPEESALLLHHERTRRQSIAEQENHSSNKAVVTDHNDEQR